MNIIFYFSGTGNSEFVAKTMALGIKECELVDMTKYEQKDEIVADIIGFVFPVYFWGVPNIVHTFISNLNIKKTGYVFTGVTMGSSSGNAIPQVNDILVKKNVKLSAGFEYKMPDNYIIAHGASNDKKKYKIVNAAYEKIRQDLKVIVAKKRTSIKRENILFKVINHHYIDSYANIDRKFCVSDACNQCGLCVKKCPVNNIKFVDEKLEWQHHCESCLKCIQYCPKKAINYKTKTINRKRYTLNYEDFLKKSRKDI